MKTFEFEREKFKELVLYVAREAADDPTFGATKLNKILFYADFEAYGEHGRPITGAKYRRLSEGPVPAAMLPVQEDLLRWGEARVEVRDYHGYKQSRLIPQRQPNLSLFTEEELGLVRRAIATLWGMDARDLSLLSHQESKGWQIVGDREEIPYGPVFLSPEEPSATILNRARALAAEHGWKSR